MTDTSHDPGVIHTLVERLNTQRLPRALDLKKKVDAGEKLSEFDLHFLEEVFHDADKIRPLVNRHPEYQQLVARIVKLYKEILDKATENENKA
jgi:phosphotransferase system IIA component